MAKNKIETVTDVSANSTDQAYKEVSGTDVGNKRGLDVNVIGTSGELDQSTAGTPAGFTVSTSALLLAASNTNRLAIVITNNGTSNIFIGHTSGVTSSGAAMGLKLVPGGSYQDSGYGLYTGDLYAIGDAAAASENVSVSERT